MTAPSVYPLHWPQGFPRSSSREHGRFQTTFDAALRNVVTSLRRFGMDSGKKITGEVLSSNMNVLSDRHPEDPGIAVWFTWDGMQVCIPVDRYDTPAANLQAIYHIIEARRVELRHGTLALVRASFRGFKALPAPPGAHWREVLKLPSGQVTRKQIEESYRALAKEAHPDAGGSTDAMATLSAARDNAFGEVA